MSSKPGYQVQAVILVGLTAAYAVGTLNAMDSWLLAAAGLALPVLGVVLGRVLRRFPLTIWEPLLLWGVGDFALFSVGLEVEFPVRTEWVALIAIVSFAMLGAWAIHRLPLRLGEAPGPGLSILTGVMMGIGLTVAVTPILAFVALTGVDPSFQLEDFGLLALAYCGAGLLGGVAVGILRPLATLALPRMLLGVAVATLIYGVVGLAMYVMEPADYESLTELVYIGLGIGVFVGPVGALALHAQYEQA